MYAINEVRRSCDTTELLTVRYARKAGMSWAEIAAALGTTRDSTRERWKGIDQHLPEGDVWGPMSLNDPNTVAQYWGGTRPE